MWRWERPTRRCSGGFIEPVDRRGGEIGHTVRACVHKAICCATSVLHVEQINVAHHGMCSRALRWQGPRSALTMDRSPTVPMHTASAMVAVLAVKVHHFLPSKTNPPSSSSPAAGSLAKRPVCWARCVRLCRCSPSCVSPCSPHIAGPVYVCTHGNGRQHPPRTNGGKAKSVAKNRCGCRF